jgi:hypothetical protein
MARDDTGAMVRFRLYRVVGVFRGDPMRKLGVNRVLISVVTA